MMTDTQSATWLRLQRWQPPADEAALSFVARLSRDNGWEEDYTLRVLAEYRRFCFLAVHAGHPVTPSEQVDQAWHQHLTYSQDYWDQFCPIVLGRALHHGPTRGGRTEAAKFRDWYRKTLVSYRRFFGQPPTDIWPSTAERFANADEFVRVNRADVIVLNRQLVRRLTNGGLLTAFALTSLSALAQGGEMLSGFGVMALLGLLLALVVVICVVVNASRAHRQRRRRDGSAGLVAGSAGNDNPGDGGDAGCGSSGCGAAGCGGGGCGG